jgi:hypothetical protein
VVAEVGGGVDRLPVEDEVGEVEDGVPEEEVEGDGEEPVGPAVLLERRDGRKEGMEKRKRGVGVGVGVSGKEGWETCGWRAPSKAAPTRAPTRRCHMGASWTSRMPVALSREGGICPLLPHLPLSSPPFQPPLSTTHLDRHVHPRDAPPLVGDAKHLEHGAPAQDGDEAECEVGVERDLEDVAVDIARPDAVGYGGEKEVEEGGDGARDAAAERELLGEDGVVKLREEEVGGGGEGHFLRRGIKGKVGCE